MSNQPVATSVSSMTPVQGLAMLGAVVVALAIFITALTFLGLHDLWAAFLFLIGWASFEHMAPEKFLSNAAGSAFGLLLAWSMKLFPLWFGEVGLMVFMSVLLIVVYMQIMQWGKTLVNATAMLYLTVGVIPIVNAEMQFPSAFLVLALSIAYFGGLIAMMRLHGKLKASLKPPAQATASAASGSDFIRNGKGE